MQIRGLRRIKNRIFYTPQCSYWHLNEIRIKPISGHEVVNLENPAIHISGMPIEAFG